METARLVQLATQLSDNEPHEVVRLLKAQGKTVEAQGKNAYIVRWEDGSFVTAFHTGAGLADEVQQLFMVLFGPLGLTLPLYGQVQKAAGKVFKQRKKETEKEI